MICIDIPKIVVDGDDITAVEVLLSAMPSRHIEQVNWPVEFPSKPEAEFVIAHNSTHILLQYRVHEDEILAAVTEDNGEVWTDSCVEFFISFDHPYYYNAEFSCIGKALLGYKKQGLPPEHANSGIMRSIKRLSSLGDANRPKEAGDFRWTITLSIPCTAFWKDNVSCLDGVKARGNFYKCGDKLTTPHFLSWTEINTPMPSFHQPDYFGELIFDESLLV